MALYRYVQTTFWTDPFVENLTREEKLLYIYLLTNSRTKQCGVYEISIKAIAFELDYGKNDYDKIRTLIEKLSIANKIKYNEKENEMLIVNWLKHNNYDNPKVKTCIMKELNQVKTQDYVNYVSNIIEKTVSIGNTQDIDTLSIPYTYPIDTLSIDTAYDIDTETQIKRKRKEKEKQEEKQTKNKNSIKTTSSSTDIDLQPLLHYWNERSFLTDITAITDKRRKMLTARIKEHGIDALYKAIDNVGKSAFLRGQNDKSWIATFDWVFLPNNFVKVLEGNYLVSEKTKEKTMEEKLAEVNKELAEKGWLVR